MDRIDMDAVREKVRAWMLAHPGCTPDQMAAELKGEYGEFAGDMAIVLRGFMARFQDHPGELAGPAASTGRLADDGDDRAVTGGRLALVPGTRPARTEASSR